MKVTETLDLILAGTGCPEQACWPRSCLNSFWYTLLCFEVTFRELSSWKRVALWKRDCIFGEPLGNFGTRLEFC